jgi:ferredoxin
LRKSGAAGNPEEVNVLFAKIRRRENVFQKLYKGQNLSEQKYLGIRTVPVAQIKGSVNRWREFDEYFREEDAVPAKLNSLREAVDKMVVLPPISLYKVDDGYYVIDGNHRVVIAKLNQQVDIDAEVYELLPPADTAEHRLWREKSQFSLKTGLNFDFTEMGSYERLLIYIRLYEKQLYRKTKARLGLKDASRHWRLEVYEPLMEIIHREELQQCFPGHTMDDLFLYVIHHKLVKSRLQGAIVDFKAAVADFCTQKGTGFRSKVSALFRGFVFRKQCTGRCMKCRESCPEGLICLENGKLKIADACAGCGKCKEACPEGNLISYNEFTGDYLDDYPEYATVSENGIGN